MSNWEERANRHAAELARLTVQAADHGPEPLPEEEAATLGTMISIERQLLVDAMAGQLRDDEASPGVAEFDAGFLYGLAFARALDDAKIEIDRVRRGRILRLVKGRRQETTGEGVGS